MLKYFDIPRSTYYERLQSLDKVDKYKDAKNFIKEEFNRSRQTYGYRRMWFAMKKAGFIYSKETVRNLMSKLRLKVSIYSSRSRYSSYKGTVGRIAPNVLKQSFKEKIPLKVLHTDVTQQKLPNGKFGYISAITDEASGEVLSIEISKSPNKALIKATVDNIKPYLNKELDTILHSDQGWQYQLDSYQKQLKNLGLQQSMSRKATCLDNAPVESFFSLLKRECLKRTTIESFNDLKKKTLDYVNWFNNERISLKNNGLTPSEYRRCKSIV